MPHTRPTVLGWLRHRVSRDAALLLALSLTVAMLTLVVSMPKASALTDPCGPTGNKISCENSLPGTDPSVWEIDGAGSPSIQGFATSMSVNVGERVDFKIDTDASAYTIQIFRSGYYGGLGARRITAVTPSARLPQQQPNCITDVETDLYDCGNWGVSASWDVPTTAVSGVYFALLHVVATGAESHIMFVVRDDSSTSDVVLQTSDTTWQAYNNYGGASFYVGGARGRALKLSYNRPFATRGWEHGRDFYFSAEYPLVRFLERNGYDVSYLSGLDTQRSPNLLLGHQTFISAGHDEYWTGRQRANVEQARDAGVNLMFLSGNEMYWRSRWEPSTDGSSTPDRTLVTYKETWDNAKSDPAQAEWTGTWRDPRFAPTSTGAGRPENEVTGTMYMSNFSDLAMQVTASEGKTRLWRNTPLASLAPGSTGTLAPHTVGYESNEDVDNGHRPPGLIRLSTTTGAVPDYLQDFGNVTAPGTTTHHMTMYRAGSGALVFSAGTVQWTWGLDSVHDSTYAAVDADPRIQQAQVNLLADMRAQPTTLQSGLVAATRSADTTAPAVAVSAPAAGASVANGSSVTISGTASDDGGVVAGVEVSVDGGSTWHAATGTTSWSYSFVQTGFATTTIKARAIDDSGNIGAAVSRSVTVACPCSVFGATTPPVAAADDSSGVELGLRFSPTNDGFVTGVRFYKGAGNTGGHVGSLWSAAGEKLASVSFGTESATGWQSATFSSPVPVAAGSTYVVSYTAPNGHYAVKPYAFSAQGVDATPLSVEGGFGAAPAGVYAAPGRFPNSSYQGTNYYVDVLFTTTDSSPLTAVSQWPLPGSSSVPATTTVSARFSKPVAEASVGLTLTDANGVTVGGTTAYDTATRTVTFTPTGPLNGFVRYTANVTGVDSSGNPVTSGKTWTFTTARPPAAPGVCPCSLFDDTTVPTLLDAQEATQLTLGVRFTPTASGTVTGVAFYKGAANTGTHTGTLWSSTGVKLAEGTFSGESTAGWQTLTFSTPVAVTKNTAYVVSYRTEVGHYSATPNAFAAADLSKGPLTVTSTAGAYLYGAGFPANASSTSYLVDVLFEKVAPAITVTSQDPAPGALDVPRQTSVRVSLSAAVDPTYTFTVAAGATAISGSTTQSADGKTLVFSPSSALPADSDITVRLAGVTSTEGASLPAQSWTFHTRAAESTTHETLFGDLTPVVSAEASDASAVELGTAFTPSRNGTVSAIRFFKGAGNLGVHVGSLWTAGGTKLASVTFTGETATGWQQADLSTPVQVDAGSTYVVSYLAPQGHYAHTTSFFNSPYTSGDLTAPSSNNGRYLYGAAGGFPTYSFDATNYFVDVVFARTPASITVADRNPAPGATSVPTTIAPSITFSTPVQSGYAMSVAQGDQDVPGTVSISSDRTLLTFKPAGALPGQSDITVTVTDITSAEGATLPTQSWTFRTDTAATGAVSLFTGLTPSSAAVNDADPVELGTAFTPTADGKVTKILFYKGSGNTGTHTGSVWSSTGTRLGTVTFPAETATGWQTATLPTPVPVSAGETYVVSYYAPAGHYAVTPGFFAAPWVAGAITAPAANNGRYWYGAGGGFPSFTFNATNYFVDLVFEPN
ncbi:DUF4082 domain-containing protein [Nocardioides sp. T2.26MG-1]|uniref:DUF4082 domain-containing protein n=1 Tax=Nocardioides sp. T2.26MG-1 TaxID=3041166 RepID=UPI0024778D05|nr:DUF4082 domain-containing protein [Nocardioides sp. T2.26MG-1]CAI9398726.1 hypothetical protein HIDPHFAB_00053 [Nocardioides sp. T2.26MG-1]